MASPGSATTLPVRKTRAKNNSFTASSFDYPSPSPPSTLPLTEPRPYRLRRSTSVEVLLEESPSQHSHRQKTPPPDFALTKSLSISSGTPTTPMTFPSLIHGRGTVFADSNVTPSPTVNGEQRTLASIQESRLTARRGSASSVVIISHAHVEEGVNGFGVVGVDLTDSEYNLYSHLDDTESVTSAEFEYMPSPYSNTNSVHQSAGTAPPTSMSPTMPTTIPTQELDAAPTSQGSATPPPTPGERRRSSVAEIAAPITLLAAHIVVGVLLTRQ